MLQVSISAQAKSDEKAFIEQMNAQIDAYASASDIEFSYQDVEMVRNPIFGNYLSFKKPTATFVADGIRYQLIARNIGMREDGKNKMVLMFPVTVTMFVTAASDDQNSAQREYYSIRLSGMPKIRLKKSPSGNVEKIRLDDADGVLFRVTREMVQDGRKVKAAEGELAYDEDQVGTDGWVRPQALSPAEIAAFFKAVRFAPDQE